MLFYQVVPFATFLRKAGLISLVLSRGGLGPAFLICLSSPKDFGKGTACVKPSVTCSIAAKTAGHARPCNILHQLMLCSSRPASLLQAEADEMGADTIADTGRPRPQVWVQTQNGPSSR